MDAGLQAIKDALDTSTGRDLDLARTMATAYVEANPDTVSHLVDLSRDECVAEVTRCCEQGLDTQQWIVEAWLLHQWEPMTIIGGINWTGDISDL